MQQWGRGHRGQGPQAARTNAACEVHQVSDEEELHGGVPAAGHLPLLQGVRRILQGLPTARPSSLHFRRAGAWESAILRAKENPTRIASVPRCLPLTPCFSSRSLRAIGSDLNASPNLRPGATDYGLRLKPEGSREQAGRRRRRPDSRHGKRGRRAGRGHRRLQRQDGEAQGLGPGRDQHGEHDVHRARQGGAVGPPVPPPPARPGPRRRRRRQGGEGGDVPGAGGGRDRGGALPAVGRRVRRVRAGRHRAAHGRHLLVPQGERPGAAGGPPRARREGGRVHHALRGDAQHERGPVGDRPQGRPEDGAGGRRLALLPDLQAAAVILLPVASALTRGLAVLCQNGMIFILFSPFGGIFFYVS